MTKNEKILAKLRLASLAEDFGMNEVLEMLATHCEAKASQNQHNFYIADAWNQARTNLMVCSEFVFKKPLTLRKES